MKSTLYLYCIPKFYSIYMYTCTHDITFHILFLNPLLISAFKIACHYIYKNKLVIFSKGKTA